MAAEGVMASATRKVLIVDDDPWVGKLVEFVARDLGYEPLLARDGAEALDKYAEELPDVVIADVVLPKVDGLEVCRRVKSTGPGAFTPVLVVSGIYRSEKEALKRFKADGFYQKPLSPEVLQRRLSGLFPPTFNAPADATLSPGQPHEVPLELEPVPRALARLHLQRRTGTLKVRVKGAIAYFQLRDGRLTFARSDAWSESIGAILQRQQRLTAEQRGQLEKVAAAKGDAASAGDIAIKEGFIQADELVRLVSNQLTHRVLETFRWREGFHSFDEGPLPSGAKSALDLDAPSLLHWGLRRLPAGAEDVGDFLPREQPLVRNPDADQVLRMLPLSRAEKWLLERADGTTSFFDLMGEVPTNDGSAAEAVRRAAIALSALGAVVPAARASASRSAPEVVVGESSPPSPPRPVPGPLCAILLEMAQRQATGTLQVQTPQGPRQLIVRHGQLVATRGVDGERLEATLARRGKIRPEVAAQLRLLVTGGRNVGEVLVELQAITAAQLQQFVRGEIRALLRDLVRLREAPATFSAGGLPERELVRHEWDTTLAVVEAVRSQDIGWLRTTLPPPGTWLQRDRRADNLALSLPLAPNERNLLNLLVTPQPAERLQSLELVSTEDQQRALWVLLALGLVRAVDPIEAAAEAARVKQRPEPRPPARPAARAPEPQPEEDDDDPLAGIDPGDDEEDVVIEPDSDLPPSDEEILIEISSEAKAWPDAGPVAMRGRAPTPKPPPGAAPRRRTELPPPPNGTMPRPPARGSAPAAADPEPQARATYEELAADKREAERRLFQLLDAQGAGEMVARSVFEQVQREKNELQAQVASLLDEIIRLKNATGFDSSSAPMAPPSSRRGRMASFGLEAEHEEGGLVALKPRRS